MTVAQQPLFKSVCLRLDLGAPTRGGEPARRDLKPTPCEAIGSHDPYSKIRSDSESLVLRGIHEPMEGYMTQREGQMNVDPALLQTAATKGAWDVFADILQREWVNENEEEKAGEAWGDAWWLALRTQPTGRDALP